MGRRPMCFVCLLLMVLLFCMDLAGFPFLRGNPLDESSQRKLERHPRVTAVGEAVRCVDTEASHSVYLRQVRLICLSETIPIKNLRVFMKENTTVPAGALLVVSGRLESIKGPRNPGEFDSKTYYASQGIAYVLKDAVIERVSSFHSVPGQFLAKMRKTFREILEDGAGEDAPLFETMLLGEKQQLEEDVRLKYQAAGILHILAISGLHISLLGMGIFYLCNGIGAGMYLSCFLALLVMVPYGVLTGESISAMRAIGMFLLAMGARILGRSYDRLTALAISAILLLLERPACLFDSSFLMSFTAVLGIHAAAPALKGGFQRRNTPGFSGEKSGRSFFLELFVSSLAVQLMMLPVLLTFYGEVSLSGLLLNLAVLPSVGCILVSGIAGWVTGAMGLLWELAGWQQAAELTGKLTEGMLLPGRMLLHVYDLLCDWALHIPGGVWTAGCPAWWQTVCYYCILGGVLAGLHRISSEQAHEGVSDRVFRIRKGLLLAALAGNCLLLGARPVGKLRITCLDVGQGDAIVAETPGRRCILIDGGSSSKKGTGSCILLSFLRHQGYAKLDAVFVSHADEDHINGIIELLELIKKNLIHLRIRTLVLPKWKVHTDNYQKLLRLAEEIRIPVVYAEQGNVWELDGLRFLVLAPLPQASGEDGNADAEVLQLEYKGFLGLFTGDIGEETEAKLLPLLADVDFLKVAHHGSRYSTSEAFLEVTRPELAVISCAETNRYGHPSPETVGRLAAAGTRTEYTMKNGAITVETDGRRVWVERYCEG